MSRVARLAVTQDALVVRPRADRPHDPDGGEAGAGDRIELVVEVGPLFGVLVGAALTERSAAVELAGERHAGGRLERRSERADRAAHVPLVRRGRIDVTDRVRQE